MEFRIRQQVQENEKHSSSVSVLKKVGKNLISGSDDGILKLWSPDLKLTTEVDTKCGGILSLEVSPNAAYTCTSDETIQSWNLTTLQNITQIKSSLFNPQKLYYESESGVLWAGDAQGRVAQYENMLEVAKFELTEEIWDLFVMHNPLLVFSARDRDVVISEIVKGNLRSTAVVRATVSGRYPLQIIKDFMICLNRDGKNIQVHDNSVESKFKLIREITASPMILNALCVDSINRIWAGGYEGVVSAHNLDSGQLEGSVKLGSCINALVPAEEGVYIALSDGTIVLVGP